MLKAGQNAGSASVSERAPIAARARIALSMGSLVVMVVTFGQWCLDLYHDAHSIAGRYDFSTYYAAAYALRHNLHANIYDVHVLVQAGAATHVLVNPPLAYTYPPLFAIVLSPFTLLSFRVLSRLWLFGNAALWLALTLLLANEIYVQIGGLVASETTRAPRALVWRAAVTRGWRLRLRDDPTPLVALALASWLSLTFAPAVQTLLLGQVNFIVLAPLALALPLTRGRHERWVGAAIGLAAMLKLTPALLIVYLLLRRRWTAAFSAIATFGALALLSILIVGPSVAFDSIPQALTVGSHDASLGHNQALFAPLMTFLRLHESALSSIAEWAGRLALIALALAGAYVLVRTPRFVPGREAVPYGLALCGMVLLAPSAWVHHYAWLLPAAAVALSLALVRLAATLGTPRQSGAILVAVFTGLACVALGWMLPHNWDTQPQPSITTAFGLPLWPLLLELRPLGALVLAAILGWWCTHSHATSAEGTE